jgi:hypothetical protein
VSVLESICTNRVGGGGAVAGAAIGRAVLGVRRGRLAAG